MLRFCDGFDSYAATSDLKKKWANVGTGWAWHATEGRMGGGTIKCIGSPTQMYSRGDVLTGATVMGILGWFKIEGQIFAPFLGIFNNNSQFCGGIGSVTGGGFLNIIDSGNGQAAVGTAAICDGQWHWIEAYLSLTAGTQTHKLYVDGVQQFNGSALLHNSANIVGFYLLGNSSRNIWVDDLIIIDNQTGFDTSEIPVGEREITTRRPNGDVGGEEDWTRSTGSDSYALVDEVNGDTADYIESGVSGDQTLFDYEALGFTPTSINSVMLNSMVHNPNTSSLTFRGACKSSSTTTNGTAATVAAAPYVRQHAFDVDPNGGGAWSQSAFDAAQFGVNIP